MIPRQLSLLLLLPCCAIILIVLSSFTLKKNSGSLPPLIVLGDRSKPRLLCLFKTPLACNPNLFTSRLNYLGPLLILFFKLNSSFPSLLLCLVIRMAINITVLYSIDVGFLNLAVKVQLGKQGGIVGTVVFRLEPSQRKSL